MNADQIEGRLSPRVCRMATHLAGTPQRYQDLN
jgi:hypothetical protein